MTSQRRGTPTLFVVLTAIIISIFGFAATPANAAEGWSPDNEVSLSTALITLNPIQFTTTNTTISWTATNGTTRNTLYYKASCNGSVIQSGSVFRNVNEPIVLPARNGCADYVVIVANGNVGTTADTERSQWGEVIVPDPGAPIVTAGNCVLQDEQYAMLARAAGFLEAELPTGLAVMFAESAGRVNAINRNPSPVSYDIGLWQINDKAHPSYDRVKLGTNPLYNASAARAIYVAANGWSPWSAFKNGSYSKNISRANAAISASGGANVGITDCSGSKSVPGDTNGDGVIDDKDSPSDGVNTDDDKACASGWNPLGYIKCALVWAFVPGADKITGWTVRVDSIKAKPPISFVVFAYDICRATFSGDSITSGSSVNTAVDGSSGGGGSLATPIVLGGEKIVFDPITEAGKFTQGSGFGNVIFQTMKIAILIGAILSMWPRIGRSFGGKEAKSDDS